MALVGLATPSAREQSSSHIPALQELRAEVFMSSLIISFIITSLINLYQKRYWMNNTTTLLKIFIAMAVVAAVSAQNRPPIDPLASSFSGVFSLNWTAGYCHATIGTQNQCSPATLDLWDSKSFTIHGLWPSSATQNNYQDFQLTYLQKDKKVQNKMWNLWPPQTNYPIIDPQTADTFDKHWLWEHQWNKHGKDYANILQVLDTRKWKNASQSALQLAYFETALNLYNQKYRGLQKIKKFNQSYFSRKSQSNRGRDIILSKKDLASLLKIPESNFLSKCLKDDVLSEIHICWRQQVGKNLYDLPCKSVQNQTIYPLTDSCPEKFKIVSYGGYGRRWQRKVMRKCKCRWSVGKKGKGKKGRKEKQQRKQGRSQ